MDARCIELLDAMHSQYISEFGCHPKIGPQIDSTCTIYTKMSPFVLDTKVD